MQCKQECGTQLLSSFHFPFAKILTRILRMIEPCKHMLSFEMLGKTEAQVTSLDKVAHDIFN